MDALIGHTGFVGTTLSKQTKFAAGFRSTTIAEIDGRSFGRVVCAGAPAKKWLANQEPEADRATITRLIAHLERVECAEFVLISTVDVFKDPIAVDEDTPVDTNGLHAYGANRRLLEEFVAEQFDRHLIVRLPGLVGPGLRKNVIYDLCHNNKLDAVDSRGVFQFYPMVNLWLDIETALKSNLSLVHLTAEPITVEDVAYSGFGREFKNEKRGQAPRYDMRTKHAECFGGRNGYQYQKRECVLAIRSYAQSELYSAHSTRK